MRGNYKFATPAARSTPKLSRRIAALRAAVNRSCAEAILRSVKEYSCVENHPMRAHRKRLRLLAIAKCCAVLCESSESLWRAFQFPPLCRKARNTAECADGGITPARNAALHRRFFDGLRGTTRRRKSFLRPTVLRRVSFACGRCGAAKLALYPRCRLHRKYAPRLCVCCMRHKRRNGFSAAFGSGGCARIFGAALLFPSRRFRAKKMRIGRRNRSALPYINRRDGAFASLCRADAVAARKLRL